MDLLQTRVHKVMEIIRPEKDETKQRETSHSRTIKLYSSIYTRSVKLILPAGHTFDTPDLHQWLILFSESSLVPDLFVVSPKVIVIEGYTAQPYLGPGYSESILTLKTKRAQEPPPCSVSGSPVIGLQNGTLVLGNVV